jgi:hypothetical protein
MALPGENEKLCQVGDTTTSSQANVELLELTWEGFCLEQSSHVEQMTACIRQKEVARWTDFVKVVLKEEAN